MNKGCLIVGGIVLLLMSAGLGYYFYTQNTTVAEIFEKVKPAIVDIVNKTVATGSIKPRKEVNIKPQVSGVVDQLYAEAGSMIKKGQKLAKIKLVPSQVNINSAKSNVELARIRLKEAQREVQRQREVNTQKLDVESAKVSYENAQKEEVRQGGLYEEGVISEQDYRQFKLDLELRKAAYENAKISSTNNLKQFETNVDIRKQELNAAIDNLALLREGASKNSSQVSNLVVSTIDGMILDIPVKEGTSVIERNNFNEGTNIATVADMKELIFEGKVDESDVGKLKEGMPLVLTVGALPKEKLEATLEYISPKGVEEEGTVKFEVRAALKATSDVFLRAGYSANADIILEKREEVVSVKERDVFYEDEVAYVEVEVSTQEFEKREIKVGLSDGVNIEVTSGIDTTAQVKIRK